MAETVKIEIPVSVKDNTGPGVQSATRTMTAFERTMQRAEQQLNRMDRSHHVRIDADDNATGRIERISSQATSLDGMAPDINVGVSDSASDSLRGISSQAEALDGSSADVDVGASDGATPVIRSAEDAVENFDGMSGSADIGANDTASSVIDSASDKAEAWAGSNYTATIGILDNVTAPLSGILGMLRSPVLQGATILGAGIGAADTVGTYTDFTSMMSKVSAISGAEGADLDLLTQTAKEKGATTKFTAAESAEAFNYMAMAGWKTGDMTAGIDGILSLAAASGEDLGTTSDIVTDALTAFHLKADQAGRFADVLAAASANANTNVGILGESFKYVAPIAGALNYSIEDTSLALGLMANSSIKGSMAGTSLKTALANMAAPTDSMKEAMDKYGLSLTDGEGRMKSLGELIDDMRSGLGGLSEQEQTAAASTIFGKEAMAGMLAIINAAPEDYEKLRNAIDDSAGSADRMAETMLDNLGGSMVLFQSALDGVKISLGERFDPYLSDMVQWLTDMMPVVDSKVNSFMDTIDNMTGSDAWKDADLFGKIDIAWDKIIADPFTKWVNSKGKNTISTAFSKLLSSASEILPGGEEAGLSSWLSAGILTVGGAEVAKGILKITDAVSAFNPVAGTAVGAAAGLAAALGAVALAAEGFRQQQVNLDFAEHFGNIELTAQQIEEFAGKIVDTEFTANVELALGEVKNADKVHEEAEAALRANDALEWKAKVGLVLSEDEKQSYSDNIETFITSKKTELESQFSGVSLAINTVIDEENSTGMIESLSQWYEEDEAQLSSLSARLTSAVETALEDGIINVKEQGAINYLQDKINSILSSWNESESQTQLDMIRLKYGHLTGADLTEGSFAEIVASYQSQRETQEAELYELAEQYYDIINSAAGNGRLTEDEVTAWKRNWDQGVLNKQSSSYVNALSFEGNTLRDTYGSEITANLADSQSGVNKNIENLVNAEFASGAENVSLGNLQSYFETGVTNQMGNGSGALKELYRTMAPDVEAAASQIDRYIEEFGSVPESLKNAYMSVVEIGAAAGDETAAWQMYANNLLENGSKEVRDALTNENNPLYETIRASNPELAKSVDRALAGLSNEDITIDDLMADIKGIELDTEGMDELLQDTINNVFADAAVASGSGISVTAEGIQLTLGEVGIDEASAAQQISDALGITLPELAAAAGVEPARLEAGVTVTIPPERVGLTSDGVQAAIQAAVDAQGGAGEATMSTDTTVKARTVDTAEAVDTAHTATDAAFEEPYPVTGSADVTLTQTNNASEIYTEAAGEVQGAFNTEIPVTAHAAIMIDYSLVNPTANISFSGAGTGTASVNASFNADGGEVGLNGPELSWVGEEGLEYVIPTVPGRRQRALDLWRRAGRAIGAFASEDTPGFAAGGTAGGLEDLDQYSFAPEDDDNANWTVTGRSANGDSSEDAGSGEANATLNAIPGEPGTGNNIEVNVNMNPVIRIEGGDMDEDRIFDVLQSRIREMADDLGDEIAERMSKIFANMPTVQEA